MRAASDADVDAIHGSIVEHLDRRTSAAARAATRSPLASHRFVVAVEDGRVVGCADLAPLSRRVAEVRSLVVSRRRALVRDRPTTRATSSMTRALASGFETLCAFTHAPGYFVQLGFSIVPHTWVPEKIEADCRTCAQFRRCGQYAVMLPLVRMQTTRVPLTPLHA